MKRSSGGDRPGMIVARTPGVRKCPRLRDPPTPPGWSALQPPVTGPAIYIWPDAAQVLVPAGKLVLHCTCASHSGPRPWRSQVGWKTPARPKMKRSRRFPSNMPRRILILFTVLLAAAPARAGLHYSGETPADLPSQWRGFLTDHRALRLIGVTAAAGAPIHLLREQYADAAGKLEQSAKKRMLTADEAADLGALLVRLGRSAKAVEVLRQAQRDQPDHFRIAANLGTAWQMNGDLNEAARALQEAVRLAPPRWKPFEEAHLNLVRLRQKELKSTTGLDDLFGVAFVGALGKPEAGKIDASARKRLPAEDVAIVQQLALWLPGDGRLLWLLGELANAHGDVRTAAAILEGVVTEFALTP